VIKFDGIPPSYYQLNFDFSVVFKLSLEHDLGPVVMDISSKLLFKGRFLIIVLEGLFLPHHIPGLSNSVNMRNANFVF
jgi:hypothetical protein